MWVFDIQGLRRVLLFSLLCLSGCSSYQTDFDCEVERGIPCTSLSDISRLIDEGEFLQGKLDEKTHSQKALNPALSKEEPCCSDCAEKHKETQAGALVSALRELVLVTPDGGVERHEI